MGNKTYLCIQRSTPRGNDGDNGGGDKPSPAQMDEMYRKFNDWKEKYKDHIADMGGMLKDGRVVTADEVKDGPFAESKEIVGGYMIVTADSIEEAAQVAQESPGVGMPGSSVEVREVQAP